MREKLARRRFGDEEGFSWRGEEVSRLEGFSDAVFGFAVTLLVVSLEVPRTFDDLLATMRGFFAFAICFLLLFSVWHDHYKFFRRYGMQDSFTVRMTAVLLFIVLFYVYPLKFLFTMVVDQVLGFGDEARLQNGAVVEAIRDEQWPLLMVIYGAGFIAVQLVFILLYLRVYARRGDLELDEHELSVTREEMQTFVLNAAVGVASILVAVVGGYETVSLAGWIYVLLFPLQAANGYLMGSRRRRKSEAPEPDGRE